MDLKRTLEILAAAVRTDASCCSGGAQLPLSAESVP
jgi:hypothetical protein